MCVCVCVCVWGVTAHSHPGMMLALTDFIKGVPASWLAEQERLRETEN